MTEPIEFSKLYHALMYARDLAAKYDDDQAKDTIGVLNQVIDNLNQELGKLAYDTLNPSTHCEDKICYSDTFPKWQPWGIDLDSNSIVKLAKDSEHE